MKSNVFTKLGYISLGVFLIFFAQLLMPILFEVRINFNFWIIVSGIVLYFFLSDFRDSKHLPRNTFLLVFFFGTVIALVRPVQFALDEESHLQNAIGVSDSLIFKYSNEDLADYDSVFKHDYLRNHQTYVGDEEWYELEHEPSKVSGKVVSFDNLAFIPGAVGWNIGRLISDKVYISYYLGRVFHVLAYATLVYFAIRISRQYRGILFLLATIPSSLYVVSGFHYDYLYFGAALIMGALLTNLFSDGDKLTIKNVLIYQLFAASLMFAKFPFILMSTVFLVIPKKYFKSRSTRLVAVASCLAVILMAFIYSGILNIFNLDTNVAGNSPGLTYFITHPLPIVRTMISAPATILDHFISTPLQYVTMESTFLYITNLVVFLILYIVNISIHEVILPQRVKYYLVLLFIGISFLMVYAITGDPRVYSPGDIIVNGVQGRYYYLMLVFLPVLLPRKLLPNKMYDEESVLKYQQLIISYSVILTISFAYYTQVVL